MRPSAPRHWVIPFAASQSEPCLLALPRLDADTALPHLRALLARLAPLQRWEGDEYALSMPHERVLGTALGWDTGAGQDGRLPWSAWWAARDGVNLDTSRAWALLSPGHWLMGRDHLTVLDPQTLGLDEAASRAALDALRPFFEEDGWTLVWGTPTRWYASHPALDGLPTASLDRVVGRNPDLWLQDGQAGGTPHPLFKGLRRLQAEAQMLLYNHPLNDAREAAGLPTVNSFWVSGCGRPPLAPATLPEGTTLHDDLRASLLSDDLAVWIDTWQQLDATVLAEARATLERGEPLLLTLCGERHAVTLAPPHPVSGLGPRLKQALRQLGRLGQLGGGRAAPLPSAFLGSL